MITRRLFGKIAAAAPAAMQAAASAGVAGPLSDDGFMYGQATAGSAVALRAGVDIAKDLRKQIADLIGGRQDRFRNYMRGVRRLDADLASMRSLSLSARIRIQAQRDEARDFEREHNWLQQQLLNHLNGKAE